jgi:glycolate oxidase iron-sulfur subunit
VQYGRLIEPFRVAMEQIPANAATPPKSADWFHRYVLFALFPFPQRMRRALWPARLAQWLGLTRLVEFTGVWKLLPPRLGRLITLLPPLERHLPPLPDFLPARGRRRARVALFTGCVADVMFRSVHWATARVLQENGCDVLVPSQQGCCGAIHYHGGQAGMAREHADQNVAALNPDHYDAVVTNVAGCGAMLKDYAHHWLDDQTPARARLAAKVRDIHEFLDDLGLVPPRGTIAATATYHDACHLAHAQKIREQPRRLLAQIPGLRLVELPESDLCCGAAGTYNLTEPEMADQLAARKLAHIRSTGASIVVSANAGCTLQLLREARLQGEGVRVMHPLELLDQSYRAAT